jgi:hypothetical protein
MRRLLLIFSFLVAIPVTSGSQATIPNSVNAKQVSAASLAACSSDPEGTWSLISTVGAPSPRDEHLAVWTGTEMLIWAGWGGRAPRPSDGARYDPGTDTWRPMSVDGAPLGQTSSAKTVVWTGTEVLAWRALRETGRGLRYDPVTDVWMPMAADGEPRRRSNAAGVWAGQEFVIWGGFAFEAPGTYMYWQDGARYDPVTDSWTGLEGDPALPDSIFSRLVWSGNEILLWGQSRSPQGVSPRDRIPPGAGARWNPTTGQWSAMASEGAPAYGYNPAQVWTGDRLLLWGGDGFIISNSSFGRTTIPADLPEGGLYDPVTDSWTPLRFDQPRVRAEWPTAETSVWTGREVIYWGGRGADRRYTRISDGARYDPATGAWRLLPPSPLAGRYGHSVVWTGREMIVFGGSVPTTTDPVGQVSNEGARYLPPC